MKITKKSWRIFSLIMFFLLTLDIIFFISGLHHFRVFNTYNYGLQARDVTLELAMYMTKIGFLILVFNPKEKDRLLSLIFLGFTISIELYFHISLAMSNRSYLFKSPVLLTITLIFYILIYIFTLSKKLKDKTVKTVILVSTIVVSAAIFITALTQFYHALDSLVILSIFNSLVYALFITYIGLSFTLHQQALYQDDELASQEVNVDKALLYSKGYQSIAKNIILSFLTFSVYFYIWIYRINKKMKELSDDGSDPTSGLLLYMFIPFYPIYWAYKKGMQLNQYYLTYNKKTSDFPTIYLLLSIFGLSIVAICLMQSEINTIVIQDKSKQKPYEELHNPLLKDDYGLNNLNKDVSVKDDVALLKELSELHKNGILTDEEYQEKKREIIKRM